MKLSRIAMNLLTAPLALVLLAHGQVMGQGNETLELMEAKTALQISGQRVKELEQELAKSRQQAATYGESLAAANDELQQTRDTYNQLRLQMEGLGIAAIDPTSTNSRMLVALSDLRILEQQKRMLADALLALSESALALANSQGEPAAQQALNQRLAEAEKALASLRVNPEEEAGGSLQNASVVSLKDDLGIAVFNVGSKHGVHPGMPFSIYRQDKPVARALVVDVRRAVCGIIVQELVNQNDPVRVGDVGKVEAAHKG